MDHAGKTQFVGSAIPTKLFMVADEWHPIWFYGNTLRLDDWDEVATIAPSWHVGKFWSQGCFGISNGRWP